MDREQLVANLHLIMCQNGAKGTLRHIASPPPRLKDHALRNVSNWYNGLSEEQRGHIDYIAQEVATHSLYNLLLLVDGRMRFSDDPDAAVSIVATSSGRQIRLARDEGEPEATDILKDLLQDAEQEGGETGRE